MVETKLNTYLEEIDRKKAGLEKLSDDIWEFAETAFSEHNSVKALADFLRAEGFSVTEHAIPYVANVTAQYVYGTEEVRELLKRQVYSPVKWQQSVEAMLADGVDTFVEIGPGRTLTSFIRKIDRGAKTFNVEKWEDLEQIWNQ